MTVHHRILIHASTLSNVIERRCQMQKSVPVCICTPKAFLPLGFVACITCLFVQHHEDTTASMDCVLRVDQGHCSFWCSASNCSLRSPPFSTGQGPLCFNLAPPDPLPSVCLHLTPIRPAEQPASECRAISTLDSHLHTPLRSLLCRHARVYKVLTVNP